MDLCHYIFKNLIKERQFWIVSLWDTIFVFMNNNYVMKSYPLIFRNLEIPLIQYLSLVSIEYLFIDKYIQSGKRD